MLPATLLSLVLATDPAPLQAAPVPLQAAPAPLQAAPDPAAPYAARRGQSVRYDVEFKAILTAPMNTRKLKVWLPVPSSDRGQDVGESHFDVFPDPVQPRIESETVFGNRFACFEFDHPRGAQIITQKFQATIHELRWDVQAEKIHTIHEWPPSFEPYRRGERMIKVDETLRKLAVEIAGREKEGRQFYAITDWVQSTLTYDHSNTSLVASTEHALKQKRGDCSDYHGLCSSLGRSLGVPTRVTYGLHMFPKNLPAHCKLEAFLPPYGWVSFDVSETQRLIRKIEADQNLTAEKKAKLTAAARDRMKLGYRDHTWLLMTRGTDYELAPKASAKVPLVATLYAEADGKPLPHPDPADPKKWEFGWMTAHKFTSPQSVPYPFADWTDLEKSSR